MVEAEKKKYKERELEDDYPMHIGYMYVVIAHNNKGKKYV